MQTQGKRKVLAVVEDLFFNVKISDAVKRAGMEVTFVKTEEAALKQAQLAPTLIILDLHLASLDPIALIERLKADPSTSGISLLGYVSHVQGELKQRAHEAGCDVVLAKSAFSTNLPQILKRHSGLVA
jgi:CheY-like chemotaxis protein